MRKTPACGKGSTLRCGPDLRTTEPFPAPRRVPAEAQVAAELGDRQRGRPGSGAEEAEHERADLFGGRLCRDQCIPQGTCNRAGKKRERPMDLIGEIERMRYRAGVVCGHVSRVGRKPS